MTEEQIAKKLDDHAKRIAQAEREGWFLPPISLDQRAFNLRMQQLDGRFHAQTA